MTTTKIDWTAKRVTPPAPRTITATCAVCGLGRAQALICNECAEQPEHSRMLIADWLAANTRAQVAAAQPWLALAAQHADSYDKLRQAQRTLSADEYARRCQAHRDAKNIYGQLLDAQAAYETALAPLTKERARLEKAERVLEGL